MCKIPFRFHIYIIFIWVWGVCLYMCFKWISVPLTLKCLNWKVATLFFICIEVCFPAVDCFIEMPVMLLAMLFSHRFACTRAYTVYHGQQDEPLEDSQSLEAVFLKWCEKPQIDFILIYSWEKMETIHIFMWIDNVTDLQKYQPSPSTSLNRA